MVKTKIISTHCSVCQKMVSIEVPEDLGKDREFYPFEYIHIHGAPEHALMLFLDQNLAVRDAIVYKDLKIAQKKGQQYQQLIRMSEIDALTSIYTEPLRFKIFNILTEGPKLEEDLIDILKSESDFREEEFNMLMLPLIKTEIVKSSWLKDSFQVCYFLVKDFSVFRVPSKIVTKIIETDSKFTPFRAQYLANLNKTLLDFRTRFLSGKETQIKEIRECLTFRSTLKYMELLFELVMGPKTSEDLSQFQQNEALRELIEKGFIIEFKTKSETYYSLLTDIKIKKFTPKYLINKVAKQLESEAITHEIALKQLEFLFEAEVAS